MLRALITFLCVCFSISSQAKLGEAVPHETLSVACVVLPRSGIFSCSGKLALLRVSQFPQTVLLEVVECLGQRRDDRDLKNRQGKGWRDVVGVDYLGPVGREE